MFAGMIARPRATSSRTNSGVTNSGIEAPKDWPRCWWSKESLDASVRARRPRSSCRDPRAAQVFANGDEFHFRSDDALTRVVHLRHATPRLCAQRRATQSRKIFEAALFFLARLVSGIESQVAIVDRFDVAALIFLNVTARDESNRRRSAGRPSRTSHRSEGSPHGPLVS